MGYNNSDLSQPIIVDVETAPHPCAPEFLEPLDLDAIPLPDLDAIQPAGNLKDPAKIAESIAKRKTDAIADYNERIAKLTAVYSDKLGRAALDWNLSRIVALAWSTDGGQHVTVFPSATEEGEAEALRAFWHDSEGRLILGFAARTFDLPTLIQRSRLLSIQHRDVNLARFGKGSVIDLREVLTFDDARYEALMPRSLKMFSRRFGLPVEDAIDGADIGQLVADGKWEDVIAHVTSDVKLTAALARRIGVLATAPVEQGVF